MDGLDSGEPSAAAPVYTRRNDPRDRKGAEMRKVIADEWMTLDGDIQVPGQADEDHRRLRPRRLARGLF
jgi:hypothetical protein